MTARGAPRTIDDLPASLPIFPLPGVLLLPRGLLPLNVFEPRYLAMVDVALGAGRLLGMIQPEDPEAPLAPSAAPAALYPIGCAGRISQFGETDDGRYLITLTGVCRFRIVEELALEPGGFRHVHATWAPFARDLEPPVEGAIAREALIAAVRAYFERKSLAAKWETIENAGDEALVTALAMACPFAPNEKQALLESPDLARRALLLRALFDMDAHSAAAPDLKPQ
jgi:hypothetical protein